MSEHKRQVMDGLVERPNADPDMDVLLENYRVAMIYNEYTYSNLMVATTAYRKANLALDEARDALKKTYVDYSLDIPINT